MLFFELIQVALGQRTMLSSIPSYQEWFDLLEVSQKQAVSGIVYAGLNKLTLHEQLPPTQVLYEWIGIGEQIRHENLRLNDCCKRLQSLLKKAGLRSSILKGQGIALYYDDSLMNLRQPGDIDIYVKGGQKLAMQWAAIEGVEVDSWDYKNAKLKIWEDIEVEMHYRVEVLLNLRKNKRLQEWFKDHESLIFNGNDELVIPTLSFNIFYIILHIYRHFLYEGIGLRQIIDYYFVLKRFYEDADYGKDNPVHQVALDAIQDFGIKRFAQGLMWTMKEVFAMPTEWMICEPNEMEGKCILENVMRGGNFGHYDSKLHHGSGKF